MKLLQEEMKHTGTCVLCLPNFSTHLSLLSLSQVDEGIDLKEV